MNRLFTLLKTSEIVSIGTVFAGLLALATAVDAAPETVRVHADGHQLETASGKPFFYLGDTAWELIHGTTREETTYYLTTRARQGFNVIQAVVLGEMNGLNHPTPEGLRPFTDNDPARPVEAY